MACSKALHAASSFYKPKFSSRQNSDQASTVCSIHVNQQNGSSTTLDHPTRRSDMLRAIDQTDETVMKTGKFGRFGGMFVPETLIASLNKLGNESRLILHDPDFQADVGVALRDYVGRETPLYFASRSLDHYKNSKGEGPLIYLKREDLNHCGSQKINNAIAQAMLAKRLHSENYKCGHRRWAARCCNSGRLCQAFLGLYDTHGQCGYAEAVV
ncbi:Tryptophan synthase beta chain 2, chloroplastic [Sesamum alatum]|uniref:Tryptophan synthase beta chain 2, chloroplastic n=1 Tax=Sesamum alatum TaxID=300844 RepID=A0AAE1Y140_9LAMI|nr:Tryptophan synthase beta chain 2, chloroplastic [Sesamum alatum]